MARRATCPNAAEHNAPSPEDLGYAAWDEWAERKSRTHTQHRCDGCGRWVIWKPKANASLHPDQSKGGGSHAS